MRSTKTIAAAGLAAIAAVAPLASSAHAADTKPEKKTEKVIQLGCQDKWKNFKVNATLIGSGKPTAKYDVQISTTDLSSDGLAPRVRLHSYNKDGSYTDYRWRKGPEGAGAIGNFETTLQQPKGLDIVYLEGRINDDFFCGDHVG